LRDLENVTNQLEFKPDSIFSLASFATCITITGEIHTSEMSEMGERSVERSSLSDREMRWFSCLGYRLVGTILRW
jgi:hypothetical protein